MITALVGILCGVVFLTAATWPIWGDFVDSRRERLAEAREVDEMVAGMSVEELSGYVRDGRLDIHELKAGSITRSMVKADARLKSRPLPAFDPRFTEMIKK